MEVREKIILMLLLSNFFEEKDNKIKNKFLLLEPLVIYFLQNLEECTKNNFILFLQDFNIDNDIIFSFLDYLTSNNNIKYNKYNDTYKLLSSEEVTKLNSKIILSNTEWQKFVNCAENIIERNNLINIKRNGFDTCFFNFFYFLFYDNNNSNTFSDINLDIAIILEDIKKNYGDDNKYYNIIEKVMHGISIVKAISYKKNINNTLPIIYIDNVLLGNIFGWCDNIRYKTVNSIINYLKNSSFKIKIHKETLDVIYTSIQKYLTVKNSNKNIKIGTLYHYFKSPDPKNVFLDINKIPLASIKNRIISKLKSVGIEINKQSLNITVDKSDDLYINIKKIRDDMYLVDNSTIENGEIEIKPSEEQTNYDYKIVKYYSKKIDDMQYNNIDEIFLTYQKAILKSLQYNQNEYIYSNIMWVKQFIKISILDNTISNISINAELYKNLIFDYFNNILSNEVIEKLNNILSNQTISDDDKELLLGYAADTDNWDEIIRLEPNEIIKNIKEQNDKIKSLQNENTEYFNNIIELKNDIKILVEENKKEREEYNNNLTGLKNNIEILVEENKKEKEELNNKIIELSDKLTEQNTKTDKLTLDVSNANKTAKKAELKTRKYLLIIKLILFWVGAFVLFTGVFLLQKNIIKLENTLLKHMLEYIGFIISSFLTIGEFIGYLKDKENILKNYDNLPE